MSRLSQLGHITRLYAGKLAFALLLLVATPAFSLITGGEGNEPLHDPGWPTGAAAVFNVEQRVAFWEGPPFGGGQYHAECRGTTEQFNQVLANFAKVDVPLRRLVIRDGQGRSFWLNPNRSPDQEVDDTIDWTFMVWRKESWDFQQTLPADMRLPQPAESVYSQIDLYAGGNVKFEDVQVPEGVEVDDQRLSTHGFTADDGTVIEGQVVDLETQAPLAAKIQLQQYVPNPMGGYTYNVVGETTADANGVWVLRNAPAGNLQTVALVDGYAPRVIDYVSVEETSRWHRQAGGLARAGDVRGQVVDDLGRPLEGINVAITDIGADPAGRYATANDLETTTAADGTFAISGVPVGPAGIMIYKEGYVRPGLSAKITVPADNEKLVMIAAAALTVKVDFSGVEKPSGYIIDIEPEGGSVVGSWGGSGSLDPADEITFTMIPPGRYVLFGRPNPGSTDEETKRVIVDLKGGETTRLTLPAKRPE
jgi:hypothetical protein